MHELTSHFLLVLDSKWQTVAQRLTATQRVLLCTGGGLYTIGAVIYAIRKPDPWPTMFGYHEIFHALTVAAATLHLLVVAGVALGGPAELPVL